MEAYESIIKKLSDFLAGQEDRLVQRLQEYAISRRYVKETVTFPEAWRRFVARLNASIRETLQRDTNPSEQRIGLYDTNDPMFLMGLQEVQYYRDQGLSLAEFFSMIESCKQSYTDLLLQAGFDQEVEASCHHAIERCFDSLEKGCHAGWTESSGMVQAADQRNIHPRKAEIEKAYAAIFQSLDNPVFLLDREGRIVHQNAAASNLFPANQPSNRSQAKTYRLKKPIRKLFEKLAAFPDSETQEGTLEKRLATKYGSRYFQIKWKRLPDMDVPSAGTMVLMKEITDRVKAEQQVTLMRKEKDALLREVYNRVKNNFQMVSSLINLQCFSERSRHTREVFQETRNRVRSLALVEEKLYRSKDMTQIDFAGYVETLARELYRVYEADPCKIQLNTDIEDVTLSIDQAIPCGLIVNELVSNALKYAFRSHRKQTSGNIHVGLYRNDDGVMDLTVSDSGTGIPEEIDFNETTSLGLHLVKILAEDQLKGTVTLNRGGGTAFRIQFSGLPA